MKVLFLSPFVWDVTYRGRYYHFFRRLVAGGHSVVVLSPRSASPPQEDGGRDLRLVTSTRHLDAWSGATEVAEIFSPDVVVASSPPRSVSAPGSHAWLARRGSAANSAVITAGKTRSCKPGGPDTHRPLLVFDYSDDNYLPDLEANLGRAAYLGQTLRQKALARLALRSDLVIAASKVLLRRLPREAMFLPNPPGSRCHRLLRGTDSPCAAPGPSAPARPRRRAGNRRLAVGILGSWDLLTLRAILEMAAARPEMAFTLYTARTEGADEVAPGELPSNVRFLPTGGTGRLGARLGQVDVAVLLPSAIGRTVGPTGGQETSDTHLLLEALSAGRPVMASAALRTVLASAMRTADLDASDLGFFAGIDALGEMLLRFSLTADPGRSRCLQAKGDKLRWAPAAEEFERCLLHLLDLSNTGVVRV
jgi:hypothetical protein